MSFYCPKCKNDLDNDGDHYFCNYCDFDYYAGPNPASLVILVNKKKQIYLTRRATNPHIGFWGIPGGFINFHESAEDAAKREIKEELGLNLDNLMFLNTYPNEYLYEGTQYYPLDIVFVSMVDFEKITPIQKEEVLDGQFFSFDNLPINEFAFETHKKAINDYLNLSK